MNYIFIERRNDKELLGYVKENELYNLFINPDKVEAIGQIYKGRVSEIRKNLGAAFIDIGLEKNGFLPLNSEIKISPGENIIVEINRPSSMDKGPKITSNWEITGENIVLLNNGRKIYISRKIKDENKRKSLTELGEKLTDNGLLFRTNAENLTEEELVEEYKSLEKIFNEIKREENFLGEPKLIYDNKRNYLDFLLKEDFSHIITNDKAIYEKLNNIYKDKKIILDESFSTDTKAEINKGLSNIKRKRVDYKSGLSIIYEPLETINFIDVNLGSFNKSNKREKNILTANLKAGEIIAKEIRIRNLTGMILIDFINMNNKKDYEKVLNNLKFHMRADYNKLEIFGFTKLGLLEMTREKLNNMHIDI